MSSAEKQAQPTIILWKGIKSSLQTRSAAELTPRPTIFPNYKYNRYSPNKPGYLFRQMHVNALANKKMKNILKKIKKTLYILFFCL